MKYLACLALLISTVGVAHAQKKAADLPECSKVVSACKSAGYEPGQHRKDGKGLWMDCITAIAKGAKVSGVTSVSKDDAMKCQEAAKKSRHGK